MSLYLSHLIKCQDFLLSSGLHEATPYLPRSGEPSVLGILVLSLPSASRGLFVPSLQPPPDGGNALGFVPRLHDLAPGHLICILALTLVPDSLAAAPSSRLVLGREKDLGIPHTLLSRCILRPFCLPVQVQ
jgi:hypothetical protein